jgi:hypothetical protein
MFLIGFGSENREARIREIAKGDQTTALILAAVHFEWMLKRAILKLGSSPTTDLRKQLEDVFTMEKRGGRDGYKEIWQREVDNRFKNAALGTVLGKLNQIQTHALDVRGKIIHGNGTLKKTDTDEAINLFLGASKKLRDFAAKHSTNLDTRLKARPKPKAAKE